MTIYNFSGKFEVYEIIIPNCREWLFTISPENELYNMIIHKFSQRYGLVLWSVPLWNYKQGMVIQLTGATPVEIFE